MVVIAIGGAASVGKTTLAGALAERLHLPDVVHVDDLRSAYEAHAGPGFIDVTPKVWTRDPRWLCDSLIASTRCLHPSIATAIDGLRASDEGGIIEGEGVDPSVVVPSAALHPIYIIEDNADRLAATFAARPSRDRFLALPAKERGAVVQMNRRYSIWLRAEAERRGQNWVAAHPWETLTDRVISAVTRT